MRGLHVEEGEAEDEVDGDEEHAFEPCGFAVADDGADGEGAGGDGDEFEGVAEDEGHGFAEAGGDYDQDGGNEEGHLNAGPGGDGEGEAHAVAPGEVGGGDVFGCVPDYREDGDAHEECGDAKLMSRVDERARHKFRFPRRDACGDGECGDGLPDWPGLVRGIVGGEDAAVGDECVNCVEYVRQDQHDGHADAQMELGGLHGGAGGASSFRVIEEGGDEEGDDGEEEQAGESTGVVAVYGLFVPGPAADENRQSQSQQTVSDDRPGDLCLHDGGLAADQ